MGGIGPLPLPLLPSALLGGTVVGSVRDLSATYYNPGGLGLSAAPASILGTKAFLVTSLYGESLTGE